MDTALRNISQNEGQRQAFINRLIERNDRDHDIAVIRRELADRWGRHVADRDAIIANKEADIANKNAIIANKDVAIANNEADIANKNAIIANKDTELAELRERLAKYEPQK